jgi:hypothetical protein
MEFPSNVLKTPSYDEVVRDTMEYARENDLTEEQAAKMLERMLRRYDMEPIREIKRKREDLAHGGKACRGRKAAGSAEKTG